MELAKKTTDWIKHWYFVYELRTSLYMLEPWEKRLFNTVLVTLLATSSYTTYLFLPRYTRSLLEYVGII
ncbi:hypothetical protein RDWZM_009397 [Blomia tropicalis]|uniref:Serine palmitoyltransferase small subunit a n=1 Tax=Blomia tropicalis TaxID=40697 RepID=A0A9Q0M6G0_BLOTA|nr:hypothetical protein BLOT_004973 [Blomia tropicalis]KAJ6218240.1 hypothetical protein RDWZM_009397 [Blomia tropicalis]